MKYRLERIRIEGLKSIEKADISLESLNVLIGANGAGKSNFLTAFRLLNSMGERVLGTFVAESGGAGALARYGPKVTQELVVGAEFELDGYGYSWEFRLKCTANDALAIENERVEPLGSGYFKVTQNAPSVPDGEQTSGAEAHERIDQLRDMLRHVKVYHFNDTTSLAGVRRMCDQHDYRSLRSDASNLAAFLSMLQQAHPKHYKRIGETIQRVFPAFDDFDIAPDRKESNKLMLKWRERGREFPFTGNDLSDGTLRFMCLTTLLLQPFDHPDAPRIVVIDEPELGLHPFAVRLLVSMLELASRKVQIVVSTQSPALVNALSRPESVIVVNRGDQGTVFERLQPEAFAQWFEDYSLGELWEKGVLPGGRPMP